MPRRKMIIDTDMGPDDTLAIIAALQEPDVEVVAITCVWGTNGVERGAELCCRLLSLLGADVPVYCGASEALIGSEADGEAYDEPDLPPTSRRPARGHAAEALARILSSRGGDGTPWQLLALGPLTNVALAIRMCAPLLSYLGGEGVDGLVVMGGTLANKGNSGLASEFNWHCDPEAAAIVTQSAGRGRGSPFQTPRMVLVPWETAVCCPLPWDVLDQLLGRDQQGQADSSGAEGKGHPEGPSGGQRVAGKLLESLLVGYEKVTRGDNALDTSCVVPVLVAAFVALRPGAIKTQKDTYVECELSSHTARGSTVIDWYGTQQSMKKSRRWINTTLVTSVHHDDFIRFAFTLADGPPPLAADAA